MTRDETTTEGLRWTDDRPFNKQVEKVFSKHLEKSLSLKYLFSKKDLSHTGIC